MKSIQKKMLSLLLTLVMIMSVIPSLPVQADTVILGEQGEIPGGGLPGPGGVVGVDTPGFIVTVGKETFEANNYLLPTDAINTIKNKFFKHFRNHMPAPTKAEYFIPSSNYVQDSALGWYDASSGNLRYYKGSAQGEKLRKMGNTRSANLNYTSLYNALIAISPDNVLEAATGLAANDKWKEYVPNTLTNEAEALKIWSWVLEDNASLVDARLNQYLLNNEGQTSTEEVTRKLQKIAAYTDLMSTLWLLAPEEDKAYYEAEIHRYLNREAALLTTPTFISIQPVVRLSAPNYYAKPIYIPATAYASYLYQATYSDNIGTNSWHVGSLDKDYSTITDGWHVLIADSAAQAKINAPSRERKTDLIGAAASSDAFNWGMGAIFSKRLHTYTASPTWTTSSATGCLELLHFNGNMSGFVLAAPWDTLPDVLPPSGRFGITTDTTPELVPDAQSTIGKKVLVKLDVFQKDPKVIPGWDTYINNKSFEATYPRLEIDLHRQTPTVVQADTVGTLATSNLNKGNKIQITIDKVQLLDMIKDSTKTIDWWDDLTSYPISANTTLTFEYDATVTVWWDAVRNTVLTPDPGQVKKTFSRGALPPVGVDVVKYSSTPSYWSEIKNGSPGNEEFEAMAGVPTTRDLYFSSGGSEYLVQVELQYIQDMVTTRSYKSYYTGGVDSEFKAGDTCPNKALGGFSVDMHNGGTYTKTWTGAIPNTATSVTSLHTATCTAKPDYTAYNAALLAANTYATTVNSTTLTHTSVSDKVTRSKTGWGATVNPQPHPPGNTSASVSCSYIPATETSPGVPCGNEMATAIPAPAGNYTITVTFTVPPHIICGPQCLRILPGIEDTWTQKITHDHMRVNVARIWKLDQSAVNGMTEITGTNEFKATVVSGDPTLFINIADQSNPAIDALGNTDGNNSVHGRIRYSVESNQHDTVIWNEGPRTNKDDGIISQTQNVNPVTLAGHQNTWAKGDLYTNTSYSNIDNAHLSKGGVQTTYSANADTVDTQSVEWKKFNERRTTLNTATVISDMIILQTSSGDQSIIYFQKDSTPTECQKNFPKVAATRQEMWDDNPLSFAKKTTDSINIGGYNGKYYTPASKYSVYENSPVSTKFDTVPAGFVRTTRPGTSFKLMKTAIDIIDTNKNGFYSTGQSEVFYKNILNYPNSVGTLYDISSKARYGGALGAVFCSTYSDNHNKINDIVIHDPVSAEFSMVLPLNNNRDQRTTFSKLLGGNLQSDMIETVKQLKSPTPKQNLVWNGDAEVLETTGEIANWTTWEGTFGKSAFTKETGVYKISGVNSFEINTDPLGNYAASYKTTAPGIGGDSYTLTGKLSSARCIGYITVHAQNELGTDLGKYNSQLVTNNSIPQSLTINFTAPSGTTKLLVQINKGNSSNSVADLKEYVYADDLVLNDNTTTTWQSQAYTLYEDTSLPNPDYITPYSIPNPDYVPEQIGSVLSFNYTGTVQTFTAPTTGIYTLEAWGAQGGYGAYSFSSGGSGVWYHTSGCAYAGQHHITYSDTECSQDGHSCGYLESWTPGVTTTQYGYGGKGGYSKGTIGLNSGDILYLYVGGSGGSDASGGNTTGGWNGGGSGQHYSGAGGGASDIRKNGQSLGNRIIVGGGGGGGQIYTGSDGYYINGGIGGGTSGFTGATHGAWTTNYSNTGGTQLAGGTGSYWNNSGTLGSGGNANTSWIGGGGGGYYGGAAGTYYGYSGAGGSSYIGGVNNGTTTSGQRAGNGLIKVTTPSTPAIGTPTIMINNAHYIPAATNPGIIQNFNYSGSSQLFIAPTTGVYTLEVWGAAGGKCLTNSEYSFPGMGGYSKGNINLTAGDSIYAYVGEAGGDAIGNDSSESMSFNGGGGAGHGTRGGGATDFRKVSGTWNTVSSLNSRVIVAGGGGGTDYPSATVHGGYGGGSLGGNGSGNVAGGTQTTGYAFGYGGTNRYGGGGGGWYGGAYCPANNEAAGGGSGYVGGVSESQTISGNLSMPSPSGGTEIGHAGNGYARITSPSVISEAIGIPWIDGLSPYIQSSQPVLHTLTNPPEDWYEYVNVVIPASQPIAIPTGGTFTPGNFINIDYGFQIYFPNLGNFYGDNSYGLTDVSSMRGKGFYDSMDTTEWTKEKYVTFDFNVIYANVGYIAGQPVPLDIDDADGVYDFYCPLANSEAISAKVDFTVVAVNGTGLDNTLPTNKSRYTNYDARHSGIKTYNIDVVGRIGNLIMEDSGDYRFSNLFKLAKLPTSWIVPGVVKDVNLDQQNKIVGSTTDIRGNSLTSLNKYLNTYGLLTAANKNPIAFPLTPDKNTIVALRKQPLRIGYKGYLDIQTLGDYYNGGLQIIPYYYHLNLQSGKIKQVDTYMDVNGQYKPINLFGNAVPGWDPNSVYNNVTMFNWNDEQDRRNVTFGEKALTEKVADAYHTYDSDGNEIPLPTPIGKYNAYGNNQIMQPTGRNRTFIGTSTLNGFFDENPGNAFTELLFGRQAQRWHFTTGLPSSAVFVEHGKSVTQANIDAVRSSTSVILMALDIKSIGSTYVLQFSDTNINNSVTIAGLPYNLSSIPYPVIEVISSSKSAKDDLDSSGTH